MNIKIGIIAAVAVVIVLGIIGFFVFQGNGSTPESNMNSSTNNEMTQNETMFESLQDIFTNKSLSLQCDYTSEDGHTATIYVKNGMVRTMSVGATPEESGDVIIKDNTMYFWNSSGAFKMTFNPEDIQSAQENAQAKQSLSDLEKYKDSCKTAVVSDSVFTPPSNITFQDMSSLMQALPSGSSNSQQAPSQEEIEALMKQFQQAQ